MTCISAVLNGHREGIISGPSINSFLAAIKSATAKGLSVQPIVVLDRANAETRSMFASVQDLQLQVIHTDFGDPGLARNAGVEAAKGDFVSFLDADDLWSENWLSEAYLHVNASPRFCIAHSQFNVIFGNERSIWAHVDSEAEDFDPGYLQIGNYWDALTFGAREIYERFPFKKNELSSGYGHEDWHWNCLTLANGLPHQPVLNTFHVKRRRLGSQSNKANESDVVPWPTELCSFSYRRG